MYGKYEQEETLKVYEIVDVIQKSYKHKKFILFSNKGLLTKREVCTVNYYMAEINAAR